MKYFKYLFLCLLSLSLVTGISFGGRLHSRLPSYGLENDLDVAGYDLNNVTEIKGNSNYISFGGETTSHSLSNDGDIVCHQLETHGINYFDSSYFYNTAHMGTQFLRLFDNKEIIFGTDSDYFIGYNTTADRLRLGTGSNCSIDATVAFEIDASKNCKVVNDLTVGGIQVFNGTPQILTGAGAVNITTAITHIVTTGADALTLVDGVEGQIKFIVMKTDVGDGTLTPANFANGTSLTFDDVGDSIQILFTNGAWHWMGGTATRVP